MAYNYEYPYTDANRHNSDWLLAKVREIETQWSDFQIFNALKWKGPWNITKQYPAYSIVDVNNTGYLSLQNVPNGVEIDNTEYWVMIADYSALYAEIQTKIAEIQTKITEIDGELETISIKNKRYLILGDSISDTALFPNSWVTSFTNRVVKAGGTVANYSLQGRTITQYEQSRGNTLIDTLSTVTGEYDHIIVFLGVNDYFNQLPLGHFNQSVEGNTTFCSAMVAFKNWVAANNPKAMVTFITPLKSNRSDFLAPIVIESYCIAIRAYCTWFGYQLIDAHSYAPLINPHDTRMRAWQFDGIHPIDAYGVIFSEWVLRQIISESSSSGDISYSMRIEDAIGTSITTEVRFNAKGQVWYYTHDFPIRATGNVKIADIPAQYTPNEIAVGSGWLNTFGNVPLITVGSALYAVIPDNAPITQSLTGLTGMTTLDYTLNGRANI